MLLALCVAPLLRRVDAATHLTLFGFGVDGARAVLGGLVASVFTFLVFVFSILLVAVQIASANLSPRVIAGILAHRPVRVCLGLMVFTFVYGLAALGRIEATVPQLPVAVVVGSSLGSIVAFLYLIDHLARWLRPVSVLSQVGREGARVIESIYPRLLSEAAEETAPPDPRDGLAPRQTVFSRAGGVVLAFDVPGLVNVARGVDSLIELVPQVGDFVAKGDTLFRILGRGGTLDEELLHQRIALGGERTIEQDPAFPFRIIVDIASKALSPRSTIPPPRYWRSTSSTICSGTSARGSSTPEWSGTAICARGSSTGRPAGRSSWSWRSPRSASSGRPASRCRAVSEPCSTTWSRPCPSRAAPAPGRAPASASVIGAGLQ